ncbi:hypothetical protein OS31_26370 [Dickeya oryzae]
MFTYKVKCLCGTGFYTRLPFRATDAEIAFMRAGTLRLIFDGDGTKRTRQYTSFAANALFGDQLNTVLFSDQRLCGTYPGTR